MIQNAYYDDIKFISAAVSELKGSEEYNINCATKDGAPEAPRVASLRKPASARLSNGWKPTHNHYQRYSDIKPNGKRPTIMDLAKGGSVQEQINGWKIHRLSTQMEGLAEQKQTVYNQLSDLLKVTESEEGANAEDKEIIKVNELIKGNLQRIKVINEGMLKAKCKIMRIFDHQRHVKDIINRCANKRNYKKRDTY